MTISHWSLESRPITCTRVEAGSRPSALAFDDGAERTLTWALVVPSMGAKVGAMAGGAGVRLGRGVKVGGRVAVKKGRGDAVVVASGSAAGGAEQAVSRLKASKTRAIGMRMALILLLLLEPIREIFLRHPARTCHCVAQVNVCAIHPKPPEDGKTVSASKCWDKNPLILANLRECV